MPYVRARGSQVAIVHGERNPDTRQVEQRILFTLYSQAEARAALDGGRGQPVSGLFRRIIEEQHSGLSFDWKKLAAGIREHLGVLPEEYAHREARMDSAFKEALVAFARQLIVADPLDLPAAAEILEGSRRELLLVADLIRDRLARCARADRGHADNPFHWRFVLRASEVPPALDERVAGLWERRELQPLDDLVRLLLACFPRYAEGWNYLGLAALEGRRYVDAITAFERTAEVGRTLFPPKLSKRHYWNDLATRPWIRGMRNLGLALLEAGEHEHALAQADRLETEVSDRETAEAIRAGAYLHLGRWAEAAAAAEFLVRHCPDEGLHLAFACWPLGRGIDALRYLLFATFNAPRLVRMVLELPVPREPLGFLETRDHNHGVTLSRQLESFLRRERKVVEALRRVLRRPEVAEVLRELDSLTAVLEGDRGDGYMVAFRRRQEIATFELAERMAARLGAASALETPPPSRAPVVVVRGKGRPRGPRASMSN